MKASSVVSRFSLGVLALAVCFCGCRQGPADVPVPEIDPSAAGAAAVTEFDTDGDNLLSKEELEQCPGLLKAMGAYDTDKDGKIASTEIESRIEAWQKSSKALATVRCTVHLNGSPLPGALVEFEPEGFLGAHLKTASGKTSARGSLTPSLAKEDLPADLQNFRGMHVGVYRIRISHPEREIPAKYNTETKIGVEIDPTTWNLPPINLKSS